MRRDIGNTGFFNYLLDEKIRLEEAAETLDQHVMEPARALGYNIDHHSAEILPDLASLYAVIILHPRTLPWSPDPSAIIALRPKPCLVLSGSRIKANGIKEDLEESAGPLRHLRCMGDFHSSTVIKFLQDVEAHPEIFAPPTLVQRVQTYFGLR